MKNIYSTKLISRSTKFLLPLAILFILFGICSIILSSIDFKYNYSTGQTTNRITFLTSYTEQSIWPTLGKGIWCGLYFLSLGIFTFIVYQEKTLISVRILCLLAFISIILSLFLFLSSIIVFQRYIIEGRLNANQRTSNEQNQLIINSLLFICGILSFISSLVLTIGTFITGNFCQSKSDDIEDVDQFYPQPPPAYSPSTLYH